MKATNKGGDDADIEYFHKATETDPEFGAAINDLGVTYFRLDRINLALEQFSKVIAVDPHAATPYLNLASAYFAQKRYSDAEHPAPSGE